MKAVNDNDSDTAVTGDTERTTAERACFLSLKLDDFHKRSAKYYPP